MIVKVQIPLATSGPISEALIYDESRTIEALLPVTDDLLEAMDGQPKAFFYAHMEGTNLLIDGPAPWQEW
jgi:hypothetical protein